MASCLFETDMRMLKQTETKYTKYMKHEMIHTDEARTHAVTLGHMMNIAWPAASDDEQRVHTKRVSATKKREKDVGSFSTVDLSIVHSSTSAKQTQQSIVIDPSPPKKRRTEDKNDEKVIIL